MGGRGWLVSHLTGNKNLKPCSVWSDFCHHSDMFDTGYLTSWVEWGRSGTCRCARTAAALEQTQVQVLHDGKGRNSATHFSKPTIVEKDTSRQKQPSISFIDTIIDQCRCEQQFLWHVWYRLLQRAFAWSLVISKRSLGNEHFFLLEYCGDAITGSLA